jgi:predicted glycosyltransferase
MGQPMCDCESRRPIVMRFVSMHSKYTAGAKGNLKDVLNTVCHFSLA